MKPVQGWTPKHFSTALKSSQAARQKYLQLGVEVGGDSNAEHTHSKLGIFLAEVLGEDWTEWITGDDVARLEEASQ